MPLARYQFTVQDEQGNVVPGAEVEVRREDTGALPQLYSDRDRTITKGNPFTADVEGFAFFYVVGGAYKVTVTFADQQMIWRHVAVGLLQESDGNAGSAKTSVTYEATGDVTIADNDSNEIHKIKNTSGGPINVFLPDVTQRGKSIRVVDAGFNAGAHAITVKPKAGAGQTLMGGTEYVIDSNGASLGLDPDVDDANWM